MKLDRTISMLGPLPDKWVPGTGATINAMIRTLGNSNGYCYDGPKWPKPVFLSSLCKCTKIYPKNTGSRFFKNDRKLTENYGKCLEIAGNSIFGVIVA